MVPMNSPATWAHKDLGALPIHSYLPYTAIHVKLCMVTKDENLHKEGVVQWGRC